MPEITKLQWRRGTAAQWVTADPVLSSGTPGFETDTGKFKIGDGVTAWTALPYSVAASGAVGATGATGATGPAGASGVPGEVGATGASGAAGSVGATGATGPAGATGATGASGGAADVAAVVHAATAKTTPADADELPIVDSAGSWSLKRWSWDNIKTAIGAWYDSAARTLTNKTLTSPKLNYITDNNGNTAMLLSAAASAVNFLQIVNSATGSNVYMQPNGADTNVGLSFRARGTSAISFQTQAGQNMVAYFPVTNPVNYFGYFPSVTSSAPVFKVVGSDTNISLDIQSKGTGTVQANGVPLVTTTGAQAVTNKTFDATNTSTQWIKRSVQNVSAPAVLGATAATDYVTFSKLTEPVALLNCEGVNNSTAFTDSGYLAADWTASGNAKISTAQSKWGNGSAYFDGTGDYITPSADSSNFAFAGDFTIEMWVRPTVIAGAARLIYDGRPTSASTTQITIFIEAATGILYFYTNAANRITGPALSIDTWYHIALSRVSGTTRMFVDGTQVGSSYTDANSYLAAASRPRIGANGNSNDTNNFIGHIQDIRIFNGIGLYSSTFTPPSRLGRSYEDVATAPGTVALLHGNGANASTTFTDSGVLLSNWSQVGSAQISTAQSKYGGSSIYLSANTQGVRAPNAEMLAFGSSDFTVEMWLYPTSLPGSGSGLNVVDGRTAGGTNGAYFNLYLTNAGNLRLWVSTVDRITAGSNLSTNTWYHVAVCRSGTSTKMFVDGTQVGSTWTDTTVYLATDATFAVLGNNKGSNGGFIGHINDFRVTRGLARYTTTFTPPTSLLPDVPVLRLPTAVGNSNRYTVKHYGPSSILAGSMSGQAIDGASSVVVASGDSNDFVSDGSNWRIV